MSINATSSDCCNPITYSVKWIRESIPNELLRKTVAIFAAALLALTVIGIPLVYLAYQEWKAQDLNSAATRSQTAQKATQVNSGNTRLQQQHLDTTAALAALVAQRQQRITTGNHAALAALEQASTPEEAAKTIFEARKKQTLKSLREGIALFGKDLLALNELLNKNETYYKKLRSQYQSSTTPADSNRLDQLTCDVEQAAQLIISLREADGNKDILQIKMEGHRKLMLLDFTELNTNSSDEESQSILRQHADQQSEYERLKHWALNQQKTMISFIEQLQNRKEELFRLQKNQINHEYHSQIAQSHRQIASNTATDLDAIAKQAKEDYRLILER
jgi:hypothetical protein